MVARETAEATFPFLRALAPLRGSIMRYGEHAGLI